MSVVAVTRALLSVWDKTGLPAFGRRLVEAGCELVSSGGTAAVLRAADLPVTLVEDVTGFPEILGGRVKTLHPMIHGGILADPGLASHQADLDAHGITPFQLVVTDLYPFEAVVAQQGTSEAEAIEHIDIGGPAMIRAAAKNHASVGVVTSPEQYEEVATAAEHGGLPAELRNRLAAEAFFRTASYDAAIVGWLGRGDVLPERVVLPLERFSELRYGENPHQPGSLYRVRGREPWWARARLVQGKEMSFNNWADAEAAWRLACRFSMPAAVVVKHTNPCGVAVNDGIGAAVRAAWECDPQSAFGGVVAVNRPLDAAAAEQLGSVFVEVVVVPEGTDASIPDALAAKPNVRVLAASSIADTGLDLRGVEGGFLAQARDSITSDLTGDGERPDHWPSGWRVASKRTPTDAERADLVLAWIVAAGTKSNAVVVAKEGAAIGVGAGDQSRIGAAERAVAKAGKRANGAAAASDAFFPFADGVEVLADAGVTAVVEPGGSRKDDEVISAADERGMALVFTGRRHFLH